MDFIRKNKCCRKIIRLSGLFLVILAISTLTFSCTPEKRSIEKYTEEMKKDQEYVERISEIEKNLYGLELNVEEDHAKYCDIVNSQLIPTLKESYEHLREIKLSSKELTQIHMLLLESRKRTILAFEDFVKGNTCENFLEKEEQLSEDLSKAGELEKQYDKSLREYFRKYGYDFKEDN